ncbi:hypothetical protein DICPUDRAFT_74341 [Dictyostelium purpureum]|uniref:Peptidase S9 prolyl oligopeptidase catalytic domain-containing protein n=1 Tax=Dictyostelium purpureum TaxID=5786 RepID=F0Z7G2_DICPU|nr:uncharacterized protein DICPUDRAFT_74341 [Dictyostelium purpureum]EGC40170.1 hypothetical protein DICPUDRAFT_74341 [Dictyostelium purpureum]|eukprot:XP_003283360.1 hypothetical protein DICPUDRAFT_74341 [Dictyostelium purpureum]
MKILLIIYIILYLINFIYSLPNNFNIIGPFPIGEREEGLDSLEAYGGIFNILVGDNTKYPSELGTNGVVGWNKASSETSGSLSVDWSEYVDWSFLQSVWGWSIWLWYGWAVGSFNVDTSGTFLISCTGTRTFFIQNGNNKGQIQEFSGDYYGYGVGQQVVQLEQSTTYNLFVRMSSSVRLNQSPNSQFSCSLQQVTDQITILQSENLVPDLVNGQLVSPYSSISVINSGLTTIQSIGVSVPMDQPWIKANFLRESNLNVLPGQKISLPIALSLSQEASTFSCPFQAVLNIESGEQVLITTNITFNCTNWGNPFLYTFLDFDSTVQYAIATPPTTSCSESNGTLCGVMLATHGAGVEASSPFWMNAIPAQENLWIIYPTGRRSWGYDWESSSRLNVINSIQYLSNNLPGVPSSLKSQYQVDSEKILFVGHSMGGHGCVSLISRFGDLAIGAACAAGFVKLQFYVFYNTRPGFSYIDPSLHGILMASIAENDNDLYTSNLVGLPLMVRYGQNDSNVNPWHSRRIARMVAEQSQNENAVIISEVPNENHWFDGILNDQYMLNYYNQISNTYRYSHPSIPKVITITTHNPASSGSRANIQILQTLNPSRSAKIQIVQTTNSNGQLVWVVSTQNVRRFGIQETPVRPEGLPVQMVIDNQKFETQFLPSNHYARLDKWLPDWNVTTDQTWIQYEKSPLTYGPIRQIFEKKFTIIYGTNTTSSSTQQLFEWASVYISNFYNTYGRGSPKIIADVDFIPPSQCSSNDNYILIGNTFQNLVASKYQSQLPVMFNEDNSFSIGPSPIYSSNGIGVSFIAPNQCGQGLLLVVAGVDDIGFNKALHAVPQRSGVLAPDFIIVGNEYGWKGVGGIISAGFFSPSWDVETDSSYFGLSPF